MSHIHQEEYERILSSLRTARRNWRISEESSPPLSDDVLMRLVLDFLLGELGTKVLPEPA